MEQTVATPLIRAAILEKFKQPYTITQVPAPPPPQGQDILVHIFAASYCQTDALFSAGFLSQDLPRIGSHEFAGVVVALGPAVVSSPGLEIGSKVGVPGRAYHACSTCFECVHNGGDPPGYSPYCPNAGNLGLTRDGGFQDYCLVDSRQVVPLPVGMSALEAAPLMCAGLTMWAALRREEVKDAKSVAIIGAAGGVGHLGVLFAAKMGKYVIAVDKGDKALRFLKGVVNGLGDDAQRVTIVGENNHTAENGVHSTGQGSIGGSAKVSEVDAVIVLSETQQAMDYGIKILKNHGTVVVVSFARGFNISPIDLMFRDIRVVGSLLGRNHQLREMLDFAQEHGVKAKTKIYPLEELNQLVEDHHKAEDGKLVVDMTLNRNKS